MPKKTIPPSAKSVPAWIYAASAVLAGVAFYIGFPSFYTAQQSYADSAYFQMVALPGKGAGLIAAKLIPKGHRVITEVPLFIVPTKTNADPVALIGSLVEKLNDTQKAAFFALSSHANRNLQSDSPSTQRLALAIFETNAIMVGSRAGIFPRTARLNHACSRGFNVVYNWRDNEGLLVVHAIRDIDIGEELLTTYTDTKQPRAQRQTYLSNAYNFNCDCDVCSLAPELSKASDARLTLMAELKAKFATWGSGEIEGHQAVGLVMEWWRVGEIEGYHSERGQMAADVVQVAASHSDAASAVQWAKLAEEWYATELGSDSTQADLMRRIVARPESHWTWGTRRKMMVGGP